MAKKKKNAEKNDNLAENPIKNEVTETSEDITSTEPIAEIPVEEEPQNEISSDLGEDFPMSLGDRLKEEKPKTLKERKEASLTQKQIFEKSIEQTPFTIFQNGILICHHSDFVKIKLEENYFEINFRKFSYNGIEIKHI